MNFKFTLSLIILCGVCSSSFKPVDPPSNSVRTVVIDAGHGGKDPGCHGLKYHEKDVALSIALKLGKFIEDHYRDVKVIYTRKTDIFLELNERAAIANNNNADLFICIHCNANPKKEVFGSETYVMGLHKTRGNLEVAKRENASILLEDNYQKKYDGFDPHSDEANIIFSMFQNSFLERSLNLASRIQKHYSSLGGRVDKGVKQAGFLVLWKTAMPSLLTETGFLSNPEEEKFLGSEKGQNFLAASLFKAFSEYKTELEGKPIKYSTEIEKLEPFRPSSEDQSKEVVKEEPKEKIIPKEEAKESPKPEKENVVKETQPVKEKPVAEAVSKPDSAGIEASKDRALYPFGKENKNEKSGPSEVKPVSSVNEKNATSSEVIFRVQVLSTDKKIPVTSGQFKGLEKVAEFVVGNMFKYTVGEEKVFKSAVDLQNNLRKKGYPEAFVVAFKNGERIPVSDALKLINKN